MTASAPLLSRLAPLADVTAPRSLPTLAQFGSRALALAGLALSAPATVLLTPWMQARAKRLVDFQGREFTLRGFVARGALVGTLARLGLVHLFGPSLAVARGHMAWVGGSASASRVPVHGLPAGVVTPQRLRARTGIHFGSTEDLDAVYARNQSLRTDALMALRYALVSLLGGQAGAGGSLKVGPVQVDNLTQAEAVAWIMRRLDSGPFLAPSQLSFVNAHCVNVACGDAAYRRALASSDLALADGMGLRLAGQWLGRPLKDNVNGTDLIEPLCAALASSGHRVFFLGGQPGVAEAAFAALLARHPGLRLAGCYHGFFPESETDAVMRRVRDAGADLLIVAMGVPRQDTFIAQHLNASGAHLAMGVGGLFDFLSQRISRAPQWVRELGMEWVWRLLQEPGRMWRRYLLGNVQFLARVLLQRLAVKA